VQEEAVMRIEQLHVKNFKALHDVRVANLPGMAVFVGPNGSGKTTLFDVFGFLHDALLHNVRQALTKRGGLKEVMSREQTGLISFELKFREEHGPLATYLLEVGPGPDGVPVVQHELLKYRRGQRGKPWHFLDFRNGAGKAVVNEEEYGKPGAAERREDQVLESPDILAIKGLGQLQRFKIVASFRRLIEDWHVSDFHINDARNSPEAGVAEHLSPLGENLPLVAQFLYEHHRELFDKVLLRMRERVPGVGRIDPAETEDGRIVLRFQDSGFKDPFVARYVSDGTIKMFAYLVLLYDPKPHPLLCVEEPENQLYPRLLRELVEEFRDYADRGGQVLVSTHSPSLLSAARLDEVYVLSKKAGYTEIRRATDSATLTGLVAEGDSLGDLWRQELLTAEVE
jgi:predicted ATPase